MQGRVMNHVTESAQPANFERLGIIVVVFLRGWVCALFAGLLGEFTAALVNIGIGARVGSLASAGLERCVLGPGSPHVGCMAFGAVGGRARLASIPES